ncbi:MAG: flagellar basal body rod protein FlgC [Myxococcota bacterium]|jgi:flagellar basal-body rod protein FlgC|nr:flagellar basal body rod protein FlgC [Myxococcota bacterium]
MSFLQGFEVSASGLRTQRARMNVISSNLANAETTRTANGGPYLRKQVVLRAQPMQSFDAHLEGAVHGVQVQGVQEDTQTPTQRVYDPGHPDADGAGYVELPNVNVLEEMVDMITASRSYEANATAFDTLKSMAQRALQIGS